MNVEMLKNLRKIYLIYIELAMIQYERGGNKEKIYKFTKDLKGRVDYCNKQIEKLSTDLPCNFNENMLEYNGRNIINN